MDHDVINTNQSSTFTMLDSDTSLYSRFTEDDSDFSINGATASSISYQTNLYKNNSTDHPGRRNSNAMDTTAAASFRLDETVYRDPLDTSTFATPLDTTTPPIGDVGVLGPLATDSASMEAVYMGDVSSSSEVSFVNWQAPLEQVRMMGVGAGGGGMGVEGGGGGGALGPVTAMMAIDEDAIKQEENGAVFCGGIGGGGLSAGGTAATTAIGPGDQHPGGGATAAVPVGGLSSCSSSASTSQLIHHHLQSGSTSSSSSSSSNSNRMHHGNINNNHPPVGGVNTNRAPPTSTSPSQGRYSPSTTALSSELDYNGECGDELHSSSPRLKVFRESPSSPSSPERHFCSSTTSLAGDSSMNQPEEEDAPRRMCLVCGDVASGFHYGVASCEACKAFFKRTIQGGIEYTCPANKDCEINKKRRKACQACRFTKCLSVGMLKEGVRLDRVRGGRQKYRRTSETPFTTPSLGGRRCLDDLKVLTALRSCEPESTNALPEVLPGDMSDLSLVGALADFYDRELVATIGWAKQVPGFSEIVLDDQMQLLQSTWGEILTLGLAFRSMSNGGTRLHFAADLTIDENSAREWHALELYNQVQAVVKRFEQISIQHDEFLLLKAIVLTNSDVRLQDTVLQTLRTQFLQTLLQVAESIRSHDIAQHFNSLLLCLPALRSADFALRRFWLTIRHQETVPMNKLFLEMLETQIR